MSRAERRRAEKLAKKRGEAPDPAALQAALKAEVQAQYQAGRLDRARQALSRLLRLTPQDAAAHGFAGVLAGEAGDGPGALRHFQEAHRLRPTEATAEALSMALSHEMHRRIGTGDSQEVPELAERLLALRPQSVEAAAFEALALCHQGSVAEASAAFGFDTLVEVHDLPPPEGWADIESFVADLAAEIAADPSMAVPPQDHPTYHNRHLKITAPLDIGRAGPIGALTGQIEAAVEDYLARHRASGHPFLRRWPARWGLEAWGTLLEGEGTVDAHIHLEGYLGMVYYPALPPEVRDGQGWLELGRPPEDFPLRVDPPTKLIEPRLGRLVMFPGYLFHRTTPFASQHQRISLAYDVVAR